jgi:hypothetical protein
MKKTEKNNVIHVTFGSGAKRARAQIQKKPPTVEWEDLAGNKHVSRADTLEQRLQAVFMERPHLYPPKRQREFMQNLERVEAAATKGAERNGAQNGREEGRRKRNELLAGWLSNMAGNYDDSRAVTE